MPPTDTIDFEREFQELVRDLRALPTAAPEQLRERVRALGEPAQPTRPWDWIRAVSWRRSLLVLAPVCVLGLVSAAVIHGVVTSGGDSKQTAASAQKLDAEAQRGALDSHATATTPFGALPGTSGSPSLPTPTPGRYQDYEASLTLRVKDVDTLHDRTAEATRLARTYGGYVASVDESTNGAGLGRSDLVLRIPVNRVEDAYFRLAQLGTVTEQHLSIRDLDQVVQG